MKASSNVVLALCLLSLATLTTGFRTAMPRRMMRSQSRLRVATAAPEKAAITPLKLDLVEPKFPEQCEFAGISLSR